jgi:hypothetical protein
MKGVAMKTEVIGNKRVEFLQYLGFDPRESQRKARR